MPLYDIFIRSCLNYKYYLMVILIGGSGGGGDGDGSGGGVYSRLGFFWVVAFSKKWVAMDFNSITYAME